MPISRYRKKDGGFYPPEVIGTSYGYDPINKVWTKLSDQIFPPLPGIKRIELKECWDETHPGPPYRSGGPLLIYSQKISDSACSPSGVWTVGNQRWAGTFHANLPNNLDAEVASISGRTAANYGAKGWNKYRPVKPVYDVGQAIAELRDVPGMLKFRIKNFMNLGKAYLAYKFGWRPFIKDVAETIKAVSKVDAAIRRIRKYNGKWQKRGGPVSSNITTSTTVVSNKITPQLAYQFYPGGVLTQCNKTVVSTDEIWFEAMMKYYIKDLKTDPASDVWTSSLLQRIYGLEVTPALLWELLPWSWLIDWFADIGDVYANYSAQNYDNLVAKYAYVMRRRTIKTLYSQNQPLNGGPSVQLNALTVAEVKERAAGSPFGFGVDFPDFTDSQIAILLALGVSRLS